MHPHKINAFKELSFFYLFYFAAMGIYIIFLPKVLYDIGYTPSQIGIILAIAPLMKFITPFFFLKRITLNQTLFKLALLATFVSVIGLYFTLYSFYWFILNNVVLGFGVGLILPYVETIAVYQLGKKYYGKSRLYGSIGFMIIALILAQFELTTQLILNSYFSMIISCIILSILLLKFDHNKQNITSKNQPRFSLFKYWPLWISLFLMQVSFGGFYNFFTIYQTDQGVSLEMTSYLWSFGVICEIIMLYFQARLLKNNLILLIKLSVLLTVVRWFLLYLFPDHLTVVFFTQSLHAFSFALYHSAVILTLHILYKNRNLAQQFMSGIAYGLGGFSGALISGWVYGQNLFLYSSIIALLSYCFLLLLKKRS